MKIMNFVKSLLPTFHRERVEEDIRVTRTEYLQCVIPPYEAASKTMKSWKFKSEAGRKFDDNFSTLVKSGNSNIIVGIHNGFKPIMENLERIERLVSKKFETDIAASGLSCSQTNLLQVVELLSFVAKYARKLLNYIYVCETAQLDEQTIVTESVLPVEIEWLNTNFVSFCTAFNVVSGNPSHFLTTLESIPDVIISDGNIHTLSATLGESRIDPFRLGLIPIWMNPVYHIGMVIAEWQASRYKRDQEELRLLQMRKLKLERLADGKNDAALDKEIAHYETRIHALNYKLHQMEAKNGH